MGKSRDTIRRRRRGPAALCVLIPLLAAAPRAAVAQEAAGLLPEPAAIARAIDIGTRTIGDGSDTRNGLYLELSDMPTGAGWISAGPGYRHWLLGDFAVADASAALSWRSFKMAQGRFELPSLARSRVALGVQARWQDLTQVTFFGEGAVSAEQARSEYRLKSTNVVAYTRVRLTRQLSLDYRAGWLARPLVLPPAGRFARGNPAVHDTFPDNPVHARAEQPNYLHGEAAFVYDTRDSRSHPTGGRVLRLAWTAYSDRDDGSFSFGRGEAEAAQFVPLAGSRVVLAMHGWMLGSHTADDSVVPLYLEPALGGHNTLRGHADYRFHDRHLLLVNVESRVALFAHVDAAAFVDAGNVAARLADLNLEKTSYGVGLRMHSGRSTFARLDVAHGGDGWRLVIRLSDPLHLSRFSRETAAIPFVP